MREVVLPSARDRGDQAPARVDLLDELEIDAVLRAVVRDLEDVRPERIGALREPERALNAGKPVDSSLGVNPSQREESRRRRDLGASKNAGILTGYFRSQTRMRIEKEDEDLSEDLRSQF